MSETFKTLIADPHWGYVWPCYALAGLTFLALSWRAIANLNKWRQAAQREAG
jgi:hypothetical protein